MPSLGYRVAFPNGEYREQAHPNAPLDLVVDHRDMGELAIRIPKLMRRWQHDDCPFGADGMRAPDQMLGYPRRGARALGGCPQEDADDCGSRIRSRHAHQSA